MKIGVCQINTKLGDFEGNLEKITAAAVDAAKAGAELAVFPELAICSYPPLDLLDRPGFHAANEKALASLQEKLAKVDAPKFVLVGAVTKAPGDTGRPVQNSAVLLERGAKSYSVKTTQSKRLLPTYDVFDESRYFEPASESKLVDCGGTKLAITICEDAWFDETVAGRRIYKKDPAADLQGADVTINLSASPFEMNKRERRRTMIGELAKKTKAPVIYVNQVGANDEILFDGQSLALNAKGETVQIGKAFEEEVFVVDSASLASAKPVAGKQPSEIELIHAALVTGIRDYFKKTGFSKAVLGLSGGIDSAVVATLAAEALGAANVLGVAMPGPHSSGHSLADAEALAQNLGIEFRTHPIKFLNSTLTMELKSSFAGLPADVTEENIQSRLRATILLALANKRNGLLLTTGNKSELAVGYCTTYGDMAGALAPIGDLYKMRVYELAKHLNKGGVRIPVSTIEKPPSAELRPNQKDEDSLGEYATLDRLLFAHIEGLAEEDELAEQGFDREYVKKTLMLVRISEFKRRQAAPVLKVTSKAFGIGRRIPIAKS